MNVKLSWTELFMNWYPRNTRLYVRGERGKDWLRDIAPNLAKSLRPFFKRMERDCKAESLKEFLAWVNDTEEGEGMYEARVLRKELELRIRDLEKEGEA